MATTTSLLLALFFGILAVFSALCAFSCRARRAGTPSTTTMVSPDHPPASRPGSRAAEPFFAGEAPTFARRRGDAVDRRWMAPGPYRRSLIEDGGK